MKKYRKDKAHRGTDKNKKGQILAKAAYLQDHLKIPTTNQSRDYHRQLTKGHSESIENHLPKELQENLYEGMNQLEREIALGNLEKIAQKYRNSNSIIILDPKSNSIKVHSKNLSQTIDPDTEVIVFMTENNQIDKEIEEFLKRHYQRPNQVMRIYPN